MIKYDENKTVAIHGYLNPLHILTHVTINIWPLYFESCLIRRWYVYCVKMYIVWDSDATFIAKCIKRCGKKNNSNILL